MFPIRCSLSRFKRFVEKDIKSGGLVCACKTIVMHSLYILLVIFCFIRFMVLGMRLSMKITVRRGARIESVPLRLLWVMDEFKVKTWHLEGDKGREFVWLILETKEGGDLRG